MGRCSQLAIVSSLSARNKGLGAYTSVWPGGGPGDSACDSGMSGVAFVSPSHTKPQATGVVHGKKESAVINRGGTWVHPYPSLGTPAPLRRYLWQTWGGGLSSHMAQRERTRLCAEKEARPGGSWQGNASARGPLDPPGLRGPASLQSCLGYLLSTQLRASRATLGCAHLAGSAGGDGLDSPGTCGRGCSSGSVYKDPEVGHRAA